MGDWNSVVGNKSYGNIFGPHGLRRRSQRGQMLIDFCEINSLVEVMTFGFLRRVAFLLFLTNVSGPYIRPIFRVQCSYCTNVLTAS